MSEDPLIGHQLATFRVESVLGQGNMARVYYGWDIRLERPVAIKVIDIRYRGNPTYARRFVQEARTVAGWRHEHIIQIYYADEEDGLYYFVMEYIDGFDLNQWIERYRSKGELLPHQAVLQAGWAVAKALDYAHRQGVVHRDVKPSNILISREGRIVLADFGLVMDIGQGSMGEVVGSPRYLAPEQARRSSDAVPQSDLYSLGVLLYEMLAGQPPFDDPSPASLALQHLTLPPPPPREFNPYLNEDVQAVLLKAISKAPEDRYQQGSHLMKALTQALQATTPESQRPTRLAPTQQGRSDRAPSIDQPPLSKLPQHEPRRNYWLLMVGMLGLIVLVILGAVWLRPGQDDEVSVRASPTFLVTDTPNPSPNSVPTQINTALPTVAVVENTPAATTTPPTIATTNTVQPTSTPTLTLTPTTPPPDGYRMVMFYNQIAFYLWNPGEQNLSITRIAFEALDVATGTPAAYRFTGSSWAEFYGTLHKGHCNALEIIDSSQPSRPGECAGFNAVRTPASTSNQLFWISRDTINQFRVLWDGEEVGRCIIEKQFCEVFLP